MIYAIPVFLIIIQINLGVNGIQAEISLFMLVQNPLIYEELMTLLYAGPAWYFKLITL